MGATLKREECHRHILALLRRLVELHEQEGAYEQAQRWARRQVELGRHWMEGPIGS